MLEKGGDVGIGTIDPAQKFHVVGTSRIDGQLQIKSSGGTGNLAISDNGGGTATINNASNSYLNISSGTYTNITAGDFLVSAGSIGVGTTTPWGKISVADNSANPALVVQQSGAGDMLRLQNATSLSLLMNDSNQLRVYDSAGTDYIQMAHDGSNAQITTNVGNVEIGTAGNDVLIGTVGSASNLVFEESSTISGQGSNTITIGVNGDVIDLGVSGVDYRVRTFTATSTDLTFNVNNTATTTVVFENTTSDSGWDETVNLAVEGTANFGATTSTEYNRFGLGTPGQAAIASVDDVFVTGDIEVDGTAYLAGGTAWTSGDFAEEMSVYEEHAEAGDVIVINREYGLPASSELYMGRLSYTGNSNEILGVITTDPAGVLKYGAYGNSGKSVVLVGTTPVKVTDENGLVERGDLLTSSYLEPGKAMRATSTEAGTLGIALEDDNGSGLVSVLLDVENKVHYQYLALDIDNGDPISTSTATSTSDVVGDETNDGDTTVVVVDQPDNDTQVVVIEYEELANIQVEGSAEFTGLVKVVDAEFTGRILVLGDLIVAGDLDLSGAITSWFWADSATTTDIVLGDAVAIVGDNIVDTMWANSKEFRPVAGIAVAIKPFDSLSVSDIESMPAELKSQYEFVLEEINSQISTSTATSTVIVVEDTDESLEQFRMVKVAIGGVVKGYTDLIPGNRYFLGLSDDISRDDVIATGDDEYQDIVNTIDELLAEADSLGVVAGDEEVVEDITENKLSRTLSYIQPSEEGANVQVIGIAKSATELLIQPSLNYARLINGNLEWDFFGGYGTSTIATSTTATTTDEIIIEDELTESEQAIIDSYLISNPGSGRPVNNDTVEEIIEDENQVTEEVVEEETGVVDEVVEETIEEVVEETPEVDEEVVSEEVVE